MLRNSYLEPYKIHKKKISEYEKEMLNHDGNHILRLERPLSNQGIRRLPNKNLSNFVNDIMCNKEIGHLLYPTSFKKQVDLYLKQQNYVYKITTLDKDKNKNFIESLKENNLNNNNDYEEGNILRPIIINYEKQEEVDGIKNKINTFKYNKNKLMKKLKIKNKNFFKNQPLIDEKLSKLSFRPINDIRIRGYQKAFQDCLNRIYQDKDFNMPSIELDKDNVFSRLYNNVIVKNKITNKYINKSDYEKFIKSNERLKNNDIKNILKNNSSKDLNSLLSTSRNFNSNNNININQKITATKNVSMPQKKEQIFNVRNIFQNLNGREFTQKVTPKMFRKCLSSLSGGPKINLKRSSSALNLKSRTKKKRNKYINYYAKLTPNNCFLKSKSKSIIHNKSFDYLDTESINNLILANSNSHSELVNIKKFRDVNYNTNLHMAILKNSYKLVDYFIKKKLDVNKKNKNGNTPLHLAIQIGNHDIIKLLLDNGASIIIKNKQGKTPYDFATKDIRVAFDLEDLYKKSINHY